MPVLRSAADELLIAGFTPFSTVDWPDKLAAAVFLQGCPWNCTYCQNPELIPMRAADSLEWGDVMHTLGRRVGLLDGVIFSGGEPTRQHGLADAMCEVRQTGLDVGLHTAGAYPGRLREVIPYASWVGLDIKAPADRYGVVTGVDAAGDRAWESLTVVLESGVDYELRMTVDPVTITRADIARVAAQVARLGGKPPVLQEARARGTRPEYADQLGAARLDHVVPPHLFPEMPRRYAN